MPLRRPTAASLFADMRSAWLESRRLVDEYRQCTDPERRRALLLQHAALREHWDRMYFLHVEVGEEEE